MGRKAYTEADLKMGYPFRIVAGILLACMVWLAVYIILNWNEIPERFGNARPLPSIGLIVPFIFFLGYATFYGAIPKKLIKLMSPDTKFEDDNETHNKER